MLLDWARATNLSGFSSIPLGYRSSNGNFGGNFEDAWYWTNTLNSNDFSEALYLELHNYSKGVGISFADKKTGFSVRCVSDNVAQINEIKPNDKEVIFYTNLMGQKVELRNVQNTIVIIHFSDGTTLKKFIP